MDADTTRQAVLDYFGAFAGADRDAFVALFTDDVHFEDPVGSHVLRGHDGVARFHKGLRRAWSDLEMTAESVFVRGDRAAVAWSARGRSASGKDIAFAGIDAFEVDPAGKIRRLEGYWDLEGVIAQM
jgi:steroid delta-isomerase